VHPLQPDLLGEELVVRVLRRQRDSGLPPDQLLPFTLIATSSEAQIQRMLTVLIRAAERHAWIADLLTCADDNVSGGQHQGLLTHIPAAIDLGVVENALPQQSTHLLWVAVQLTQRLLDRLGHPNEIGYSASTEVVTAERARLLSNLGFRLSELGRPEEALRATSEAVEVFRRLADVDPDAFQPNLARGLEVFARVRAAAQVELTEALNAAEESVMIYELQVERLPQFTNDLCGALAMLADVLDALGRNEEAAQVRGRIDPLG